MSTFIINILKLCLLPVYFVNNDFIKLMVYILSATLTFGVFNYLIKKI